MMLIGSSLGKVGKEYLKVAFITLGCKVNQFETETMMGLFRQKNYQIVDFHEKADFYVINTCSVTHLGEAKSRKLIRQAIKRNPKAIVAATGCYAQVNAAEIEKIEGVSLILGHNEQKKIVELMEQAAKDNDIIVDIPNIMEEQEFEDIPLFGQQARTRAYLKIQDGCNNFCSYCIIPYARGPLRSRSIASIKREVGKLLQDGFQEIVLTGIHLGAYGKELAEPVDLTEAVETVLSFPELHRVRLGSLESIECSPTLIQLMQKDTRFARHLHLPLQAGDDEILQKMNRAYKGEDYVRLTKGIIAAVPDIAISTDIIVGFPGETEAQFQRTIEIVEALPLAKIHVFPYSPRRGTPAATMPEQVAEQEKKKRVHRLQEIAHKKEREFAERFLGREMEVLWEQRHNGFITGHTSNYLKVCIPDNEERISVGKLSKVLLEKVTEQGIEGIILSC